MGLSPYNPDCKPIEELFRQVKVFLWDNHTAFHSTSDQQARISYAFNHVTMDNCCAYIKHAGYLC